MYSLWGHEFAVFIANEGVIFIFRFSNHDQLVRHTILALYRCGAQKFHGQVKMSCNPRKGGIAEVKIFRYQKSQYGIGIEWASKLRRKKNFSKKVIFDPGHPQNTLTYNPYGSHMLTQGSHKDYMLKYFEGCRGQK